MTISRRLWLATIGVFGVDLVLSARRRGHAASAEPQHIDQPALAQPRAFMDRAFDMRRRAELDGDQPFGAVVVHEGRIVGQAPSAVVSRSDPTAHAEIEAIRDAAQRLRRRNLSGCTLYSSSRPCSMCEAAAYWAGIDRMVHGADLADAEAPRLARC
jgi:tRNA(Arg) A34 adenosine deaminase TadA